MSERVLALVALIKDLSVNELRELNEILGDDFGGLAGVREPRRPAPESPGDTVAEEWPQPANLPEDYWESAQ